MSTINQDGTKVVLPRRGPDEFWRSIRKHYAGRDRRKWTHLAMLALRESAGWNLDWIGMAFGHTKGHITRCLQQVRGEVQRTFLFPPELPDRAGDAAQD